MPHPRVVLPPQGRWLLKAYLFYVYDFTTVAGKRADATKKRSKNKLLAADLDDMVNQQIKSQKAVQFYF